MLLRVESTVKFLMTCGPHKSRPGRFGAYWDGRMDYDPFERSTRRQVRDRHRKNGMSPVVLSAISSANR